MPKKIPLGLDRKARPRGVPEPPKVVPLLSWQKSAIFNKHFKRKRNEFCGQEFCLKNPSRLGPESWLPKPVESIFHRLRQVRIHLRELHTSNVLHVTSSVLHVNTKSLKFCMRANIPIVKHSVCLPSVTHSACLTHSEYFRDSWRLSARMIPNR